MREITGEDVDESLSVYVMFKRTSTPWLMCDRQAFVSHCHHWRLCLTLPLVVISILRTQPQPRSYFSWVYIRASGECYPWHFPPLEFPFETSTRGVSGLQYLPINISDGYLILPKKSEWNRRSRPRSKLELWVGDWKLQNQRED